MNPQEKDAAIADYVEREVAGLRMGLGRMSAEETAAAERAMGRVAVFAFRVATGLQEQAFDETLPAPDLETGPL